MACRVILGTLFLTLVQCVLSTNYDDYIARLAAESEALQREFIHSNPRGQYVLDKLKSDEHRSRHPILGDAPDGMYDIAPEDWRAFLEELQYAKMEAARPIGEEDAAVLEPQLRWYTPRRFELNVNANQYMGGPESASRRTEVAYPNPLWGEHKVSGGSGEIGQWLDFALLGAQSQDEDEEQIHYPSPFLKQLASNDEKVIETKNNSLPAYCDPPNPCPIGYDPDSLPTPCDPHIPYSKKFNRDWILAKQASGECPCDAEHMHSCPAKTWNIRPNLGDIYRPNMEQQLHKDNPYLHGSRRKRLVAKKAFSPKDSNRHYYWQGPVTKRVVKKAGRQIA